MRVTIAAAAATALAGLSLGAAAMNPVAEAATPTATQVPVPSLQRVAGDLRAPGGTHAAALSDRPSASLGAVTLVNDDLVAPATLDLTVTGPGVDGEVQLATGSFTSPRLLPAGAYTVTVTDAGTGATDATRTLTVTPGGDSSEVAVGQVGAAGAGGVTLVQLPDPVGSVPAGEATVSVRNVAAVPLDVTVNGGPASAVAAGGSVDVPVTSGNVQISVGPAGAGAAPLFSGFLAVAADSYVPLYLAASGPGGTRIGAGTTPFTQGYQYVATDGGLFNYGSYPFRGSTGNITLSQPMVGGAEDPDGSGYWLVAADGGVFAFGAPYRGSLGGQPLNQPIVGMAATIGSNGQPGYLLVGADGGVFAFNAGYYGSLAGTGRTDVVGIAADPSTGGYVIAEADGSYTQFGPGVVPAPTPAAALNQPIVGIAETPDGGGAWLVAADGGVFTIGNAPFEGSTGSLSLNQPVVGLVPSFDGLGYDLVAADGGVFAYGDARFFGSTGGTPLNRPIVGPVNS